jgi:hypothetical protein
MRYTDGTIEMSPTTWNAASTPAKTGSTDSNDITKDVMMTVQGLLEALNAVGFLSSSRNLATAMEEFGSGMLGALACVGVDLAVVGAGLAAAAAAFSATDAALARTFAQLDRQLGYFTSTATGVALPVASAAAIAALNSLSLSSASSSASSAASSSGVSLSTTTLHFAEVGGAIVLVGVGAYAIAAGAAAIDWGAILAFLGLAAAAA